MKEQMLYLHAISLSRKLKKYMFCTFEDPKPARLDSSSGLSGFTTHVAYGVGCHTVP